jgi:hypothetical protein
MHTLDFAQPKLSYLHGEAMAALSSGNRPIGNADLGYVFGEAQRSQYLPKYTFWLVVPLRQIDVNIAAKNS